MGLGGSSTSPDTILDRAHVLKPGAVQFEPAPGWWCGPTDRLKELFEVFRNTGSCTYDTPDIYQALRLIERHVGAKLPVSIKGPDHDLTLSLLDDNVKAAIALLIYAQKLEIVLKLSEPENELLRALRS